MVTYRIGVLGGIDPESTREFYEKLITRLKLNGNISKNEDFPQIIINSIPAPALIYDKISAKDLKPYLAGLKELDKMNPDFIVMVCNTIYLYYEELQSQIKTPILDLREEVKKALLNRKIHRPLIIGTPNTIRQGLYRFEGIKSMEPDENEIAKISNAIFDYSMYKSKEKQVKIVENICMKYTKLGADAVILGCTDLAVMLRGKKIPQINTIDVLVEAVILRVAKKV
ncbi:Aspartate racemase [uncultured archaeon]|nr:Aspartate racemase [uncultured archaeon]